MACADELFDAIKSGNAKAVKTLLDKGADPKAEDFFGYTPLMWAAFECKSVNVAEVVKLLLDKLTENDINKKFDNGNSAFHMAAASGKKDVLELLLAKGADLNAEGKDKNSALMQAAIGGHEECVKFLLDKGATYDLEALKKKEGAWMRMFGSDMHKRMMIDKTVKLIRQHAGEDTRTPGKFSPRSGGGKG